ncbi:hypothetical protein [Erwinia typographi]|uniref:hypothetical protein n=1 Tax=Erwinia typographi TaxID=371042 RepID=UPI000689F4CA|nr:hypothetical protein [Erwinia typographi]
MRELNLAEVNVVTGAAGPLDFILDRAASSILSGVAAAVTGGAIGYLRGGDATGVLGLNFIGQLVGAFGGAIIGGIGGVVGGAMVPFEWSYPLVIDAFETVINGGIK